MIKEGWSFKKDENGDRIKYVDVMGAVICKFDYTNGRKEILLIQRAKDDHWPNYWEFPRGKCDASSKEKLHPCLSREVKEETNLDVIPIRFIDKFTYSADEGKRQSTQFNYLCYLKPGKQELKLSHEHQDYKWVSTPGEIELLVSGEMKNTLLKIFDQNEILSTKPEPVSDEIIDECLNIILEAYYD